MPTSSGGLVSTLFANKKLVPIWPYPTGGQEIAWPAKRNRGKGYLSATLFKACAVALKGDVTGITVLEPPGRVRVASKSQSGGDEHHSLLYDNKFYTSNGKVCYDLGLTILADALAYPDEYVDLLDALEVAQKAMTLPDEGGARKAMGHLADELYFAVRYGGTAKPGTDTDLLDRPDRDVIGAFADVPAFQPTLDLDIGALTSPDKLRAIRRGKRKIDKLDEKADSSVDAIIPIIPLGKTVFRGWQLQELKDTLNLGMNAILIGPTATGKSLCVHEAKDYFATPKPFFVIEGHESLKEFDLLGGYTPIGGGVFVWQDGIVVQAMKTGGLLFCDEANRMPTRTLNVLLGILSRKAVVLTEHGSEEIKALEGFQVVMAMNLGKGYAINTLDTALVNRFDVTLEFRYLPSHEEIELLMEQTGISRKIAEIMVKVAGDTRLKRKNKELAGELTPRSLRAWAIKYMHRTGATDLQPAILKKAAQMTWIPQVAGTDADGYIRDDVAQELGIMIESHTPTADPDPLKRFTEAPESVRKPPTRTGDIGTSKRGK